MKKEEFVNRVKNLHERILKSTEEAKELKKELIDFGSQVEKVLEQAKEEVKKNLSDKN
jgi:F0F1-type ATP synthase membrane subunit b/b'